MGFDVHAFAGEGPIMLGGIAVPHSPRPRGPQRRRRRPPRDHRRASRRRRARRHRRAFPAVRPSMERRVVRSLSAPCRQLLRAKGAIIDHVDCTIIAEEPKVGPHRAAMRERIAEIAGIDARSGEHQGDHDRRPRLHRPARRHCRAGGREHSHGLPNGDGLAASRRACQQSARSRRGEPRRRAAALPSRKAAPAGWSAPR